jgi:hypothetical protein
MGDVPAVSGTEAGPDVAATPGKLIAHSGSNIEEPGVSHPGSPVLLAISRRKARPPYPDHTIDGINAAVLAAAPGGRCPPPALHNLDHPGAGTGGLVVGAHRGRARAGR